MYELDEYRKENLSFNRRSVLKILKIHREGWFSTENAAMDLLDIRHRFILPWMIAEYWNEDHPYNTLSNRIIRIATTFMGKEWVENYMEIQKKARHCSKINN